MTTLTKSQERHRRLLKDAEHYHILLDRVEKLEREAELMKVYVSVDWSVVNKGVLWSSEAGRYLPIAFLNGHSSSRDAVPYSISNPPIKNAPQPHIALIIRNVGEYMSTSEDRRRRGVLYVK